jgi:hypothetical protein
MVVLVPPRAQFTDEFRRGGGGHASVRLILVGAMTALDFPIGCQATGRDVRVGDAKIMKMPREIGAPFGAIVPAES